MKFRARGEQGYALVVALVFLAVFGILSGILLQYAQTNLKGTFVARAADAKLFGADGGIEYGIHMLRNDPSLCPDIAAGVMTIGSLTVNGRTVTVQCQTTEGTSLVGGSRYAVITTSAGAGSLATQNGIGESIDGGPVYVAGAFGLAKPLTVTGGDVLQHSASCPGGLSQDPNLIVVPPNTWQCTTAATPDPAHALPTTVPPTAPAPVNVSSTCRLFKPGTYTSFSGAKSLLSAAGSQNYFASGVYYLNSVGRVDIGSGMVLFGGQPQAPETQVLPGATPCTSDAASGGAASGKGVKFIMGGNSRFRIAGSTMFELFTRVAASSDEGTDGITMETVPASSPGWNTWSSGTPVLDLTSGGAGVAVHGLVYAANADVRLYGTSGAVAQLLNGVVANRLTLQAAAGSTALGVQLQPGAPLPPRTVKVIATAPGTEPGEVASTNQVVVRINNDLDGSSATTVQSWRKV